MAEKTERFGIVFTAKEKRALKMIAADQGISSAQIVRQLIRTEAQRLGFWGDNTPKDDSLDYQIIISSHFSDLVDLIHKAILEGWRPLGGPAVCPAVFRDDKNEYYNDYFQAMVR